MNATGAATAGGVGPPRDGPPPPVVAPRIVGGAAAGRLRYPYVASVTADHPPARARHECGGSLIAPDVVLTAAHCDYDADGKLINGVEMGRHRIRNEDEEYERFVVEDQLVHPHFISNPPRYDFKLMKLYGQSKFDPVQLNFDAALPSTGDLLTMLGWGVTDMNIFKSSRVLNEVELGYVPNDTCEKAAGRVEGTYISYEGRITSAMMCAHERGKDACLGDSGGPLVVRGGGHRSGQDLQVGLSSWGAGCATSLPGVYARLSHVEPWMRKSVCVMSSDPPDYFRCDELGLAIPSANEATAGRFASAQKVFIHVEIQLDYYPEDTGYVLQSVLDGKVYAHYPIGTFKKLTLGLLSHTIAVDNDKEYALIMLDGMADGICCEYGDGYSAVHLGRDNTGPLLAYGDGRAPGRSVEHRFAAGDAGVSEVVNWLSGVHYDGERRIAEGSWVVFRSAPDEDDVYEFRDRDAWRGCDFGRAEKVRRNAPGEVAVKANGKGRRYFSGKLYNRCIRGGKIALTIGKELVHHAHSMCSRVKNSLKVIRSRTTAEKCRAACTMNSDCFGYQHRSSKRRNTCHLLRYRPVPVGPPENSSKVVKRRYQRFSCGVAE